MILILYSSRSTTVQCAAAPAVQDKQAAPSAGPPFASEQWFTIANGISALDAREPSVCHTKRKGKREERGKIRDGWGERREGCEGEQAERGQGEENKAHLTFPAHEPLLHSSFLPKLITIAISLLKCIARSELVPGRMFIINNVAQKQTIMQLKGDLNVEMVGCIAELAFCSDEKLAKLFSEHIGSKVAHEREKNKIS